MKCKGGIIWVCKNYDGDVMSDMVVVVFGLIVMMFFVLVLLEGNYEFEVVYGIV